MMSASQIVALSNKMARRAARLKKVPYVPFDEKEITCDPPGFRVMPNIGSYRPKGWKLTDYWTVDKGGCSNTGPAWGIRELRKQMLTDIAEPDSTYGYAIIEEGVFQLVVGQFLKRD